MSATIRLNGEERPLEVARLVELLQRAGIDPAARGTAVALNGAVVPRAAWPSTGLAAGDAVEIVQPFRGG
jgi:sulfur carrier protein